MLDEEFWSKYFNVYDILNKIIPYQKLLNTICDELDIKKGEKILDAGSGTGNLVLKIKNRGGEVVALDNVEQALEQHRSKDDKVIIVKSDLTKKLPFTNDYFDKICSNNVIYTISKEKRDDLMKEFYRILKPGGKIVISNIHKGFKPIKIYIDHIIKDFKESGILKLIKDIIILFIPTLKMFYFNFKIKKEHKFGDYDFVDTNEQINLLTNNGFIKISKNKKVYSNQAILNSAYKK